MSDYWQDKRITNRHVTCAWGLVLVVLGLMAVTSLTAPDCPDGSDRPRAACADDLAMQEANAQRP